MHNMRYLCWIFLVLFAAVQCAEFRKLTKQDLFARRDPKTGSIAVTDDTNGILDYEVKEIPLVILFTAKDPKIGCELCKQFQPVYDKLAALDTGIAFVEVDFSKNQKLFLQLKMNSVPHVWILPRHEASVGFLKDKGVQDLDNPKYFHLETSEHFSYTLSEGTNAKGFAQYISEALRIPEIAGLDEADMSENYIAAVVFAGALLVLIKKKLLSGEAGLLHKLIQRRVWAGISVVLIVLFISGYMFTVVRGVPLLARNENGPFYFAGGSQYQIGIESFLVGGIYLLIGFFVVLLADVIPKGKVVLLTEGQQSLAVVLASIGLFYGYSLLTSVYLRKDGGYPYGLIHLI